MANLRIISRLDVKAPYLIKGVHLEGLRKLGDPKEFAKRYYEQGVDEIIYIDAVASLYQRNTIVELIKHTAEDVFIPITAGGGVRSVDDARALLRAGADKVAINTAAINRPELINEIAEAFGSQCMVLSVQAKQQNSSWEAYSDQGREHTGRDVIDWVLEGQERGAGEILLTSIDCEGTRKGFDIQLTQQVSDALTIPVIASGGMGTFEHFRDIIDVGHADAVAIAHVFHYGEITIEELRIKARDAGINVRPAQ
ncbi:imidazole glycerol phosphate synthase cyclase subunit [Rhodospirillales bacterium]|nr:imidazole glycerol phosphate synthase cyclase subunit [Rhodospirillales bacterium]